MRKLLQSTLAAAAGIAVVAGALATPSPVNAWGDNLGGRRVYTRDQINHGVLGNKIVFNSITDSIIGDERNFVGARENTGINAGQDNVWEGNDITVENGKEYLVRIYVHNNSPLGYGAVAENTRVAFNIPTTSAKQVKVNGYIYADNASPSQYWDYVNFNSDHAFHLEYVYGSALIENKGFASQANGGAKPLSDNIVEKAASEHGVQIGYESLNGRVPGCYDYSNYITIRVKAVYDNHYTLDQKVRLAGTSGWTSHNVEAKVGDRVEFQTTYTNTNTDGQEQRNVMIKTVLPKNLRYVPGSTKLYNGNHPNGASVDQDTIITTGINIGHYAPNANAFIRFTAEVVDEDLAPGSNTLVNWVQGGVGSKTIQDYATVMIQKAGTPIPQAKEYDVRVKYIYEDGSEAAPTYHGKFQEGDSFYVDSPAISGYTPDVATVRGTVAQQNLEYTVVYTKIKPDQPVDPTPDNPTPEDPTPDQPTAPEKPSNLPNTGPEAIVSSIIAAGSLTTSAGYYVASRKALRR